MPIRARPSASTAADFSIPISVMGRRISGSMTVESAAVSWSAVGTVMVLPGYVCSEGGDRLGGREDALGDVAVQVLDHPTVDRDDAAAVLLRRSERVDHLPG